MYVSHFNLMPSSGLCRTFKTCLWKKRPKHWPLNVTIPKATEQISLGQKAVWGKLTDPTVRQDQRKRLNLFSPKGKGQKGFSPLFFLFLPFISCKFSCLPFSGWNPLKPHSVRVNYTLLLFQKLQLEGEEHWQARIQGVGCHSLLQGIFLTQESNPGLPHCRFFMVGATREAQYIHCCC